MTKSIDSQYKAEQDPEDRGLSLLDIIRILGGFLLLNALASWYFTATTTWGYRGKWLNYRYVRLRLQQGDLNFTLEELAAYDGHDPSKPIYVAVNGSVYDVSSASRIYGQGGSYNRLAGKDAARVYVTGCFGIAEQYTHDLRGLDPDEAHRDIKKWQRFYESNSNYWLAGHVTHPPLKNDPPEPCQHVKYPGTGGSKTR